VASATWVNGRPAVDLRERDGSPHRLLILDVDDERVTHVLAYAPS
jgi:hypothetical protein